MAKINNPTRFSDYYKIDPDRLSELGVFNPSLCIDTSLFIDPLLLAKSRHSEISVNAKSTYHTYFTQIIKILNASQKENDTYWRNAKRLLTFSEVKWSCLGYGSQSITGSGSGEHITNEILQTAKDIISLGIQDPDLFMAMGVFEEGFGPDRISDMTASVIFSDLLAFNSRILDILQIPSESYTITLGNSNRFNGKLAKNPYTKKNEPILLLPYDILRKLPIVNDWEDILDAAEHNDELRNKVNQNISEIWRGVSRGKKSKIKATVMGGKTEFLTLLDIIHDIDVSAYNIVSDPKGELHWKEIAHSISQNEPFVINCTKDKTIEELVSIVHQIINQFKFLVEERRLSEDLYHCGKHRSEKSAQLLFFATAYSYCKANNIDITPEADTGNGPVDFKFSIGFQQRCLVEVKLSSNTKLLDGYQKQLNMYKQAEETGRGFYLVMDLGNLSDNMRTRLYALKTNAQNKGEIASEIVLVDSTRRDSASKL